MLPTVNEIIEMSNDKLFAIIKAGESCNWNIRLANETKEDVDTYVETLYAELEGRKNDALLTAYENQCETY